MRRRRMHYITDRDQGRYLDPQAPRYGSVFLLMKRMMSKRLILDMIITG